MAGATAVDAVAAKVGLPASDTTVIARDSSAVSPRHDAMVTTAFSAKVANSSPVAVGDGAVAFQVTEQKKVTDTELKQNEAAYMDMLRSQQARSLRTVLLQRLRKEAKVEINDELLQQTKATQQGA